MAWDTSNLYLAFDVSDPVYIQDHTGWLTWKGDCVQLEFNLDPDVRRASTGNQAMDKGTVRTSEIDIALTSNGPEAYRTASFDANQEPVGQLSAAQLPVSVTRTSDGLQYRVTVPWKTLGAITPPAPGQRIGFQAFVNDMNQPGQLDPTAIGIYAADVSKDPAEFGTLVLQPR
jgi:hypothetical protein